VPTCAITEAAIKATHLDELHAPALMSLNTFHPLLPFLFLPL
jgi:hypothetical protein